MRFQPESPHSVPWVTVTDFGCAKAGKGWKMISFQQEHDWFETSDFDSDHEKPAGPR